MKSTLFVCLLTIFTFSLTAQNNSDNFWQHTQLQQDRSSDELMLGEMPESYQLRELDVAGFSGQLQMVPKGKFKNSETPSVLISLPTPDGESEEFYVFENSVVAPEVAHLYTVKTYQGYAKDNPKTTIRCDISATGFRAVVFKGSKTYAIEPLYKGDSSNHIVFNKKDIAKDNPIQCAYEESLHEEDRSERRDDMEMRTPSSLRTYRLAFVTSGEYSQQYGGAPYSTTNVLNALASAVNTINGIYMTDLGVKFTLVTNTSLIFQYPNSDPFNLNNQGGLIDQCHAECTNALGTGGFDVGHLLVWANTGGLAYGGVVCDSGYKGRGFSGNNSSTTTLIVDYACHEIGHQFYAPHNFVSNECGTSVDNFRFEPGEGSSIMCYAGLCGPSAGYQGGSDPFFHTASLNEMNFYINNWGGCYTTSTPGGGNSAAPSANANSNITIPKQTPFVLVGTGTDANDPSGQLTYSWEQYDGTSGAVNGSPNCNSTTAPLFKYEDPVSDNFKILPAFNEVLNGNNNGVTWQKLPCTARTLNFNLIVRDNNANWGRTDQDAMVVTVANTGPFTVSSPNGGENWAGNSNQNVTWNVNGTNSHCSNVDILVSTDGGTNFSVVASGVSNDGSHSITVPNTGTSNARVLVQCSTGGGFKSASTFFDVSNANFTITFVLPVELIDFTAKKADQDEVVLNWTTASEFNASHFEVQKSTDGVNFSFLTRVEAMGTSTQEVNYQAFDKKTINGINYYRLKQVDFNGDFKYSEIESVQFEGSNDRIIYFPNPGKDIITISGVNGEQIDEVKIYNQLGQMVMRTNTVDSQIDISGLSGGIYVVEASVNGKTLVEKLIVE